MDMTHKQSFAARFPLVLLVFLAAATACSGQGGATVPAPNAIPAGWKVFPTPTENSETMLCANYAQPEQVSLSDAGALQIVQLPRRAKPIPPPELLPGENTMPGMAAGISGLRSVLRVENGWLSGFDQGEWGGHLSFVDANGKATELYQENVRGFIETSRGVMVFVGLAHLTLDAGEVLIAEYPITAETMRAGAKLGHSAPRERRSAAE